MLLKVYLYTFIIIITKKKKIRHKNVIFAFMTQNAEC